MHCAMSCALALKCPDLEAEALGWLKEIIDAIGPGDSSRADLRANKKGIRISKRVHSKWACKKECLKVYGPKEK